MFDSANIEERVPNPKQTGYKSRNLYLHIQGNV